MRLMIDDAKAIVVEERSATGAVKVSQSKTNGLKVLLNPAKLEDHDEHTLAVEIERTVIAARYSLVEQTRELCHRHGVDKPAELSTREIEQAHAYQESVANLACMARSTDGHVAVEANGNGDFFITFRNNAVRRTDLSVATLEASLNEAIGMAFKDFSAHMKRTRRHL